MERHPTLTPSGTPGRRAKLIKARNSDRLEARLAVTPATRTEAYRLRHDGYLSAGYIEARKTGTLKDKYDGYRTSKTIVLYKNGVPAASARVCLFDPSSKVPGAADVPALELFADEIADLLKGMGTNHRPARAVEITKLARHPDFTRDNDLVFAMFRMTGYLILDFDADVVLTLVRPSHIPFYKRMGFHNIAEPRPYPKLNVSTGLMACFRASYEGMKKTVPVLKALSSEDETYARFIGGHKVPVFPQRDAPGEAVLPAASTRFA